MLDPTFNGGQPVLTPADGQATTGLDAISAVGVQPNGQIVVVGETNAISPFGDIGLAVRRYNADGSLDTSFATNGEADLALGATTQINDVPVARVLIQPDGSIVLGATIEPNQGTPIGNAQPVVVRLTPSGALDSTFGTGGVASLTLGSGPSSATVIGDLALSPDGKIVVGGTNYQYSAGTSISVTTTTPVITRLLGNGAVDSSFNGGNLLPLDPSTYAGPNALTDTFEGLAVTSVGRILVSYQVDYGNQVDGMGEDIGRIIEPRIAQFNLDGTLDTRFGVQGVLQAALPSTTSQSGVFALQPNGSILLDVGPSGATQLFRFTASGQPDASFADPKPNFAVNSINVGADGSFVLGGTNPTQVDGVSVQRYLASGVADANFGTGGVVKYEPPAIPQATSLQFQVGGVAFTPAGQVVAAGTTTGLQPSVSQGLTVPKVSRAVIVQFPGDQSSSGTSPGGTNPGGTNPGGTTPKASNDYDGDGKSDIAAELAALGLFAYRQSTGGDVVQPFGIPGPGLTVPAPGDYDGDGKTDVAAYLPSLGVLAYRPSSGGSDVYVRFGPAGVGNAIPVPGDYDGDGKTDVALFLPGSATFVVDPSSGAAPYAVQYGAAGAGQTIPVAADYDGDGTTDFAVYLPATGEFFRRLSSDPSTANDGIAFGSSGVGASIPAPGDYEGIGRAQFAVYLPAAGAFAVLDALPKGFASNYAVSFGAAGAGQSIPVPGDYDGDGKDDFAVDLPALGSFAYRPSHGGDDVIEPFGMPGLAQTVPAAALPIPDPSTVQAMSLTTTDSGPDVAVPLVGLDLEPTPAKKVARS